MSPEQSFEEELAFLRGTLIDDPGTRISVEFQERLEARNRVRAGTEILEREIRPILETVNQYFAIGRGEILTFYNVEDQEHPSVDSAPYMVFVAPELPDKKLRQLRISVHFASYDHELIDININGVFIPYNCKLKDGDSLTTYTKNIEFMSRLQREIINQLKEGPSHKGEGPERLFI